MLKVDARLAACLQVQARRVGSGGRGSTPSPCRGVRGSRVACRRRRGGREGGAEEQEEHEGGVVAETRLAAVTGRVAVERVSAEVMVVVERAAETVGVETAARMAVAM